MADWMNNMKRRWGIDSTWQFWIIMLVFSLAGSSIVWVKDPLFHLLRFPEEVHWGVKTIAYILIMFPLYQVLLLFWAAVFFQWSFFWEKEKKMGRWFLRRLGFRTAATV